MGDSNKELYACNGCVEQIPNHRARIDCHNCPSYHLCANCFIIKQYVPPHIDAHSTMVLKQSGFVVPNPPGFPPRPAPALPPRHNSTAYTKQTKLISQLPTANWGALWSVMKAPLEKKQKPSLQTDNLRGPVEMKDISTSPSPSTSSNPATPEKSEKGLRSFFSPRSQNPTSSLPPSPPKSVHQGIERINSAAPSYPHPASWEPLFEEDSTPTPIFVGLMSTIFSYLDSEHSGYLSPEVYSEFLDVQGYEVAMNLWKNTMISDGTSHSKDVADLELGIYYTDLSISHTLLIRPRPTFPHTHPTAIPEPSSLVEKRIKGSMKFSANMPMLSRQGFVDLSAIEYLRDPARGHESLQQAVYEYGIWKELGNPPRTVLPEKSIPRGLRVEDDIHEESEGADDSTPGSEKKDGDEAPEMPPRPELGTIHLKGGEQKIEALANHEEFKEAETSTPEPELGNLKVKGGNKKAEAVMNKEAFENLETSTPKLESGILKLKGVDKVDAIMNKNGFKEDKDEEKSEEGGKEENSEELKEVKLETKDGKVPTLENHSVDLYSAD